MLRPFEDYRAGAISVHTIHVRTLVEKVVAAVKAARPEAITAVVSRSNDVGPIVTVRPIVVDAELGELSCP
jgi:hypothetical protein